MNVLTVPPLAVYVHLPWCVRKCPYCDFNSHPVNGSIPEKRYIDALLRDLSLQAPSIAGRPVQSIFIGGGTPSLFAPAAVERLLTAIKTETDCIAEMEVTLEANPGTLERGQFAEYRAVGINRISLGGQSFNAAHLQALGRIHSTADISRAAAELHAAGLTNFNIDLMYGLPGQSLDDAQSDIRAALTLGPAHLSHYQLTLEPGTAFFHRPPVLPDDDRCWEMQLSCQALLAENGFPQYEVSAYAPFDRRCLHNVNYWRFGDYLGLGAGAHGKLTYGNAIHRTTQPSQPRRYMEQLEAGRGFPEVRTVPAWDLPFEFMLNALRLTDGFERAQFEAYTGLAISAVAARLDTALSRGLLESEGGQAWYPSSLGRRFLNELQMTFLPEKPASSVAAEPA